MSQTVFRSNPAAPPPSIRASDKIQDELRWMIVTSKLPPGMPLTESYLMDLLHCGRTPLREALQRLTQEYLVVSVPHRGFSVASLNVSEYSELMEAVVLVESSCAHILAARMTDAELGELDSLIGRVRDAAARADFVLVAESDYTFHSIIARATGNRYLADMILRLHSLGTRFSFVRWKQERTFEAQIAEHSQIAEALRRRDVPAIQESLRNHLLRAKDRALGVLSPG